MEKKTLTSDFKLKLHIEGFKKICVAACLALKPVFFNVCPCKMIDKFIIEKVK